MCFLQKQYRFIHVALCSLRLCENKYLWPVQFAHNQKNTKRLFSIDTSFATLAFFAARPTLIQLSLLVDNPSHSGRTITNSLAYPMPMGYENNTL